MPIIEDEYAIYYNYMYRVISNYNICLYPSILMYEDISYRSKELVFNKEFKIEIYENYTLLKCNYDLGCMNLNINSTASNLYEEFMNKVETYNCFENCLIYISNSNGKIDKVCYSGKSVDTSMTNGSIFEYDITITRIDLSIDDINDKLEEFRNYINN